MIRLHLQYCLFNNENLQVLDHTVNDEQRVAVCSLNVKDEFQVVRCSIQEAEDYIGKCVDVLVNCAGMTILVILVPCYKMGCVQ